MGTEVLCQDAFGTVHRLHISYKSVLLDLYGAAYLDQVVAFGLMIRGGEVDAWRQLQDEGDQLKRRTTNFWG